MWEILVIGNGFDLAAGLNSSFKDFMEQRFNVDICQELDTILTDYMQTIYPSGFPSLLPLGNKTVQKTSLHSVKPHFLKEKSIKRLKLLTIWDLIFYYQKGENFPVTWCDVEAQIRNFLEPKSKYSEISYKHLELKDYNPIEDERNREGARVVALSSAIFNAVYPNLYSYESLEIFEFL